MIYSGLLNNYIDDFGSIVPAIEAVIFSSEEPVSIERLLELFNIGVKTKNKDKDKDKEERVRQEF